MMGTTERKMMKQNRNLGNPEVSRQTKDIVRRAYESAKRSSEPSSDAKATKFVGEEFLARI